MPAHARPPQWSLRWSLRWSLLVALVVALLVGGGLGLFMRSPVGHSGAIASTPIPTGAASTGTTPTSTTPATTAPAGTAPARTTPAPTTQPAIPNSASGRLAVVGGGAGPSAPGTRMTYRLEIEAGLPLDGAAIAAQVQKTLTDPRGWQPIEHVAFVRTTAPASFELILASPALVDRLCYPLDTVGELSCRNGNRVILNAKRWATAVPWYRGHLDDYRAYLVNHEVGHRLGHGHKTCPAPGAPAPVMVQQSKSLYGCSANPWPSVAY